MTMGLTTNFPADIDECAEGSHICDFNAECTNTIGGHNCTCVVGYSGNGSSCGKFTLFSFTTSIKCMTKPLV